MQKPEVNRGLRQFIVGLLLFPILELFPYLLTLSFKIGETRFPPESLSELLIRNISAIFPTSVILPSGVEIFGRSVVLQVGLLSVVLVIALVAKFFTGHTIALGKVSWSLVGWGLCAVTLAILGPFMLGAIFQGEFNWSLALQPDCQSIPMKVAETSSILIFLFVLLGAIFVIPLNEEFLYRGYLAQLLGEKLGYWGTAIVTSTLFALFHFRFDAQLILFFLAGLLLYFARVRFGGMVAPIILHSIANASIVFFALLSC